MTPTTKTLKVGKQPMRARHPLWGAYLLNTYRQSLLQFWLARSQLCYSLVTLALQNSALAIVMHYSRVSTPANHRYSAATAVLLNEILKGLISLVIAFHRLDSSHDTMPVSYSALQRAPPSCRIFLGRIRRLWRDILSPDCWKLSIPAILYGKWTLDCHPIHTYP